MRQASSFAKFAILYTALYCAFGVVSPFLPAFLGDRGLTAVQIAAVIGSATAVRLVSGPLFGRLADRQRLWRGLLAGCIGAAGMVALAYVPAYGVEALLMVSLAQSVLLAPVAPIADALALSASAPVSGKGFEYGWVRGAGSAAFIAGSIAAGYAAGPLGLVVSIWLSAIMLGVAALSALRIPNIAAPSSLTIEQQAGGFRALLDIPSFRRLLLIAALVLGSHALHDTFAMIRWRDAGISTGTASLLWSESVAAEVVVFFFVGPPLVRRLGPAQAAMLAASAGVVRWSVMAASTETIALALVEPLHGLTFALLHLASMRAISEAVPNRFAATAQALYGTGAGVSTTLLTLTSGWLYARFEGHGFWAMAILCAVAIPLAKRLGVPATNELSRG